LDACVQTLVEPHVQLILARCAFDTVLVFPNGAERGKDVLVHFYHRLCG